jgi:hypothetical protein
MATEADNVNSGALGTLLIVGAFATLGIAFVVTALVRSEMSEEAEKKEVSADRPMRDLVSEQRAKLDAPAAYIDRTKGLVSLPIDRAMELTVEGLKKDPSSATPPASAAGGAGGAAPTAAGAGGAAPTAASSGGAGGSGGAAVGTTNPPPAEAPAGTVGAEKPAEEPKDKTPGDVEKKKAPKKAPTPAVQTPVAPTPPAPAPPANGQ